MAGKTRVNRHTNPQRREVPPESQWGWKIVLTRNTGIFQEKEWLEMKLYRWLQARSIGPRGHGWKKFRFYTPHRVDQKLTENPV